MPGVHHKYSPSKLDRIAACPGSALASEGVETPDSQYAVEGTMLHGVMENYLIHGEPRVSAPLSMDQAEIIAECCDYVDTVTAGCEWRKPEQRVKMIGSDFRELTEGTMDVIAKMPDRLLILDWKFGYKDVDADTLQLKAYAAAAAQTFGADVVEAHIYQPRAGKGKPIIFTDIGALVQTIEGVIVEAERPDAAFRAGPHCKYCAVKADCIAYKMQTKQVLDLVASNVAVVSPAQIGVMAARAQTIKAACDEIMDRCKELTKAGMDTGWKFVKSKGRRSIINTQGVFDCVNSKITHAEFLALTTIPLGKLEELYCEKRKAEGVKTAEAKRELATAIADYVQESAEVEKLVRKED